MIHAYYIPSTLNGVEIMIQTISDLKRCAAHVVVAKNAMIHHRNLRTLYKLQSMLQLLLPEKLKIWLLVLSPTRESLITLNLILSLLQLKSTLDTPVLLQLKQQACLTKQMMPHKMLIRSTSFYSKLMTMLKPPKMLLQQQTRPKLTHHKTKPP